MSKNKLLSFQIFSLVILSLLFFSQCKKVDNSMYWKIRDHINKIKVIDTHEHQHRPEEYGDYRFRFYHLISASYLSMDITSAGVDGYNKELIDSLSLDELWKIYGDALNFSRGTTYYSQFVKGIQKLYDFNELYFSKANIEKLSPQIELNYLDYLSWFSNSFHNSGFELMFQDQYWKPYNTKLDTKYFALVFEINPLVEEASSKPEKDPSAGSIYKEANNNGFNIRCLDDYLKFCVYLFKKNIENHAICLKNSTAYRRSIYYEDVSYEQASTLFERPSSSLSAKEKKKIEDFVFHWIIKKAIEYNLPIQIHTGYLSGSGNQLDNGEPVKLNNLFLKYPKAKFILFHGGFPWTGEFTALGKMFPNVYLDLVWLPQISRESAINALDVIFDCVPYNKIFWGGDSFLIEEATGSLEIAKDVVSEVLSKRIERGLLTEEVAFEITERIFRKNAIDLYRLEERLGRAF